MTGVPYTYIKRYLILFIYRYIFLQFSLLCQILSLQVLAWF